MKRLLILCVLIFSLPVPAYASPSTTPEIIDNGGTSTSPAASDAAQNALKNASPADKTALESLVKQLDAIDQETEIASENYNESLVRLSRIQSDIKKAEEQYAIVAEAYKLQSARLNDRAVSLYRQGDDSVWQIVFEAKSFRDLVTSIQYLSELSTNDAKLLAQISDQKATLEDTIAQLADDEKEAQSLQFELKARKIEVAQRNTDREDILKSKNPRLLTLLEATQANEAAAEQQIATKIEYGQYQNITVTPGSPVETALAYRGIKYVWGGSTKSGLDCSGLLVYVFRQHGVTLPHYSGSQLKMGTAVTGALEPGDAVFFGSPVHHVGIYIGGGYFVHAPHTGDVVKISKLSIMSDYVGARRYNWQTRTGSIR
ncbi:MAG: C40 family peptidase [Coriobacteriia bacterium]|nr:C40 family peptidase [Coriobacteriia bacterium]